MEQAVLDLRDLSERIDRDVELFDSLGYQAKKAQYEAKMSEPGFWDHPEKAEPLLKSMKQYSRAIDRWQSIRQKKADLLELSELITPDVPADWADFLKEVQALEKSFKQAHLELVLNGPYDTNDAILVLSAGTGGVEAQDWTEMLLRMYLRFAEKRGWSAQITDKSVGSEAGIKSVTVEIKGDFAYGYLKSEHGVHRLVRLSPFNAKNLRQTSFALAEVLPVLPADSELVIDEKDLRVDTYRSGGAGGQHVNKTDSAVRLTHLPTNIVVTCQSERSQIQNRAQAMSILKGRILQRMMEEKAAKVEELKGGYKEAAWGNQIRSYVFQPYTMVKDHRTDAETSQVYQVMDGDLDLFIEAYLTEQSKLQNTVS